MSIPEITDRLVSSCHLQPCPEEKPVKEILTRSFPGILIILSLVGGFVGLGEDALMEVDSNTLLWVNSHHSRWADSFFYNYSQKWIWVPFYITLFGVLLRKYSWRQVAGIAVGIALVILAADQVCASLIRPLVERPRPTHSDLAASLHIVRGYTGGGYGFPSCHAANAAALAGFLSALLRRKMVTLSLVLWMALICYSRMYLGVHYPTDLLAGIMIGGSIGVMTALAFRRYIRKRNARGWQYVPPFSLGVMTAAMFLL